MNGTLIFIALLVVGVLYYINKIGINSIARKYKEEKDKEQEQENRFRNFYDKYKDDYYGNQNQNDIEISVIINDIKSCFISLIITLISISF